MEGNEVENSKILAEHNHGSQYAILTNQDLNGKMCKTESVDRKAQQWRVISKCQLLVVIIQFGFISSRIYHIIKTSLATDDCIKLFVYVMPY